MVRSDGALGQMVCSCGSLQNCLLSAEYGVTTGKKIRK